MSKQLTCTWIARWNDELYWEYCLCMTLTWSDFNPVCIILYSLWAACRWRSVRSCCDKQEVRYHAWLNLSRLLRLAVAQHCHPSAQGRSIFRKYLSTLLKFSVCGRKHIRTYTHTSVQCSSASVGLAQACPNYCMVLFFLLKSPPNLTGFIQVVQL